MTVLTGGPGSGRSTALRALAAASPAGPIRVGGGLATLRHLPGLALTRAIHVRLPEGDLALATEAVRARVGGGLLVVDDLHWADPLTLAVLPLLAPHCRVLAALRTPSGLPGAAERRLREYATSWTAVPGLADDDAEALVLRVAPGLGPATVREIVRRGGGNPLALRALAGNPGTDTAGSVEHAVATAVAALTRPARTAIAALGLLGRPALVTLLGPGVPELVEAGWVEVAAGTASPTPPYVAEVAAALLPADERTALHVRLADLVGDGEAARHLRAAGRHPQAYPRALAAVDAATTTGERAGHLLLAAGLEVDVPTPVRFRAAEAALAAGRPAGCLRVLDALTPAAAGERVRAAVLRSEALLQGGDGEGALAAAERARPDLPAAPAPLRHEHLRASLLAALQHDTTVATELAQYAGSLPDRDAAPVRVALAATAASRRAPDWESALADAADQAHRAGRPLDEWWSGWLLVETLATDGRLGEAADHAETYRARCADQGAYSWETRFLAAWLWCAALRAEDLDTVARRAVDLLDRTLPRQASAYALAAACLTLADTGALAAARARLGSGIAEDGLLAWVDQEVAWLDGDPARAAEAEPGPAASLAGGLHQVTARWAAHDLGAGPPATRGDGVVRPVRATLAAWREVDAGRDGVVLFTAAAEGWHGSALREEVRCLLAAGLTAADADTGLAALLDAERAAGHAGLVVLLGRVHRALRRFAVRRESVPHAGTAAGPTLTARELEVLTLVAAGEPTRRIAGQLGISRDTVETHVRAGMRKLGARTRTEAATLLLSGSA
jgi:DNA-binding CsgD family transcriptional regulator